MRHIDPNIVSDPHCQDGAEVERVFNGTNGAWSAQSLFSIITDLKELNGIDVEKNLKCAAYATCKLYNSFSSSKSVPLYYEEYAKNNSVV